MVVPLPDYIQGELKEMLLNMLNLDADKRPTANELLDTELMQFQAQIDKANENKEQKGIIEELKQRNKEFESKVRNLEIEKVNEKIKTDQAQQGIKNVQLDMEELLKIIKGTLTSSNSKVMKLQDWNEMKQELEKPERGTQLQIDVIRQKKIKTCQQISAYFIGKTDNKIRKQALNAGIADALLKIFSTYPLESITQSHIWAFFELTYIDDDQICYDAFKNINFTGLVRLLDHPDIAVVHRVVISIKNIIRSGSNSTQISSPHPYYQSLASCDGINKLFILFKKNLSKRSKDEASICIGQLFRAKEISNTEMRKEVISNLKAVSLGSDESLKGNVNWGLKYLAQNEVNRAEIEKDGFKIPDDDDD
ncbi:MAG: hypothetical protein EZS28_025045 [Streblomastix strix]|uniref:Protein kinase domain-containing protein n=1 Tax=Streblomastix strix TaxID=222440 RepID=A0A5J4VAH0_9EUKA|nr:MAG: hypothetical protein EZS28_025045 [Streblomastix strix]